MTSRVSVLAALLTVLPVLLAQEPSGGYMSPSPEITAVLTARPSPAVLLSPRGDVLLVRERPGLPPVAELAEPELRLAGRRFNPDNAAPTRRLTSDGMRLVSLADGASRDVTGLPGDPRLDDFDYSPDGERVAFTQTTAHSVELWVLDVGSARARRVTDAALNAIAGKPFVWSPDSRGFIARLLPSDRGATPAAPMTPDGPIIEEATGRRAAARTYQDLLRTDHDEATLEFHLKSRLARVAVDGRVTPLGEAELATDFAISPDGRWLLVTLVERPFSRTVGLTRFAAHTEVRPLSGGSAVVVSKLAVADNIPSGADAVRSGRRTVRWRSDEPATVWFVEAQDRGDPARDSKIRDVVSIWRAPFDTDPVPIAKLARRFGGVTWGDASLAVVTETWRKTRAVGILAVDPSQPETEPRTWFEYSSQDSYAKPGDFVTRQNAAGLSVLRRAADGSLFLIGEGATAEGNLPFLDKFDPATGESTRLFRSGSEVLERPVSILDESGIRFLTSRESVTMQPNYHVRSASGISQITDFPNPYPGLEGVTKEFIRTTRADGVGLTATLWLPPDWKPESGALPTLLWAYPREFVSADDAGQVTGSPNQFSRISPSRLAWLVLAGYAVLDEASMPVVGRDGAEPNDTFIEQIVMNARALIDEAAKRGVTDPARVGVAGHSYGAFMTANLLAHCDLFKAGIARSGAYNRTLTPFGFQGESRTYWEAPEVYDTLSPFHSAGTIDHPILLIHGMADNNSGTFPIQTERLFAALRGLGKTARYVQLPLESHGYASRESVLHVAWESQRWLDIHVKGSLKQPGKPALD